jgi:D-alanyl-D-alanine dipeptidase
MSNDCLELARQVRDLRKRLNGKPTPTDDQRASINDTINALTDMQKELGCFDKSSSGPSTTPAKPATNAQSCAELRERVAALVASLRTHPAHTLTDERLDAVAEEIQSLTDMEVELGCFKALKPRKTITATWTATVEYWTDGPFRVKHASHGATLDVTFLEWSWGWAVQVGDFSVTFGHEYPVTFGATKVIGTFTPPSAIDLHLPLHAEITVDPNLPTLGEDATTDMGTEITEAIDGMTIAGSPIDAAGNVAVVGARDVSQVGANFVFRISGALSGWPR